VHPLGEAGGDGLQKLRVAVNVLNEQLWRADCGVSLSLSS
jgi:hypothetical protein